MTPQQMIDAAREIADRSQWTVSISSDRSGDLAVTENGMDIAWIDTLDGSVNWIGSYGIPQVRPT